MKNKKIFIMLLLILIPISIYIFSNKVNIQTANLMSNEKRIQLYGEPVNVDTGEINNKYFNIYSEGENPKETTQGINAAIEYANNNGIKYIKLKKGIYAISGIGQYYEKKGIKLSSNITLDFNSSKIIHESTDQERYSAITVFECENVTICNGILVGDKDNHIYSGTNKTHEYGYGIEVRGGRNIEISNMEILNFTGDGILVSEMTAEYSTSKKRVQSEAVDILNCNIHNNRRQGISVIDVNNINIYQNEIHDISGTAPTAAIDLECNLNIEKITNAKIYNNKFYNLQRIYAVLVNRGTVNVDIYENDIIGGINVASVEEIANIKNNNIYGGEVKADLIKWNSNAGYGLNKVVVRENKIDNCFIYANNVKDLLVMDNYINHDKLYINCSNAGVYNNRFMQNTTIRYKLENNKNNQKYDAYVLNNYSEKINGNLPVIIDDKNIITLYENQEKIEEYINRFI